MPTINISKTDLENLLQKKLSINEVESLLSFAKGELKETEGDELKIEIVDTNRPDLLSIEGIARQMRREKPVERRQESEIIGEIIVDPELRHIRPYVGGFVAKGMAITELSLISIIQAQEKLCEVFGRKRRNVAIGVYNAQKIEFPIFYRAVPPEERRFVPLEFDDELNLKEILELHPKGKDYSYILEGVHRFPFLEDCHGTPLSFPPIINSRVTGEVKPGDTDIFCEVTATDIEQLLLVVNILGVNFKDRGATIYPCVVKYPYSTKFGKTVVTPYEFKHSLTIEYKEFERLLGRKFANPKIKDNLEKMGYGVKDLDKRIKVSVPSYRWDVMHPVDVIEDFALFVGYNSFEPAPLEEFTVGKTTHIQPLIDRVRKIMIGCGFEEVMSNILTSRATIFSNMRVVPTDLIEVDNPVSESYGVLRNSIIPSLLVVEAQSSKATYPHRIFEVGEVVISEPKTAFKSRTEYRLSSLIAHPTANFSELHSFLNNIAYYLQFTYKLNKTEHPSFIQGRIATISTNYQGNTSTGIIGEIHPEVLENFKIKCPVVVFEFPLIFI